MKMTSRLSLLSILAAGTITTAAFASGDAKDWHYGDGKEAEHWSHENSAYAMCDTGKNQSPIDLGAYNAKGAITVSTNYGPAHAKLKVSEHKIQVEFPAGMTMLSGDKKFNLLQLHFHTPAEHPINGTRHPLEGHFVHTTDKGELGVLGIMFNEGEANAGLQTIIDAMEEGHNAAAKHDGKSILPIHLDTKSMMPIDQRVYRYMGSLTTPPCSEGVNWHVALATVNASAAQIAAISSFLQQSARSVQPLNNRLLVSPAL